MYLSYSSLSSTTSSSSPSPIPQSLNSPPTHVNVPPPPAAVIMSPCAACKILRRRCVQKCVLAPYFPPSEPLKFTIAHKVFGASNIIKLLQGLPETQRADAVSSIVYEATARFRDPVYGCAGAICHLQNKVTELQEELARAQAEIVKMQGQQDNLLTLICMDLPQPDQDKYTILDQTYENLNLITDDVNLSAVLEPLWT